MEDFELSRQVRRPSHCQVELYPLCLVAVSRAIPTLCSCRVAAEGMTETQEAGLHRGCSGPGSWGILMASGAFYKGRTPRGVSTEDLGADLLERKPRSPS